MAREKQITPPPSAPPLKIRGGWGSYDSKRRIIPAAFRALTGFCMVIVLMLFSFVASAFADTSIINVYDANGNLVTGDGRYYEYNDANQLVQVRQGDTITGPVIAEYFYDASGQRVKKIENGVVTYYVGKHFEKQVGGANAGNTSYYFGDDNERVAKKDPTGNVYYYHLDHLDGINAVTDSAGTIVSKTDYLPFGDIRNGSSGTEKYSYTGKEKDKTDLYYFDARYNSPEFRHFTQADIAEPDYDDPQDLNRYSYVGNNPLSYVDYDGFKKKKKKHLSKREQRARSLGLNPDKDKYKVGKWSDREYKHALSEHRKSQQKARQASSYYAAASSSRYSLAVGGSVKGNVSTGSLPGSYIGPAKSHEDFGDWCGSWFFNVPDKIGKTNMSHGCKKHDSDYGDFGKNYQRANQELMDNIIGDNGRDSIMLGAIYSAGVDVFGFISYIPSQYKAGRAKGYSLGDTGLTIIKGFAPDL